MILVINCFTEEAFARDFDRAVAGRFGESTARCRFHRATRLESLGDSSACTHLLISGSVASATEEQVWDRPLAGLVRQFMDAGKPVLGICYGHQFLAKVLAGPAHVRRAARSEFGFLQLCLAPNPLFEGLPETLAMVSHFDEACDLPPDFRILASSGDCAVHAFQYRDLPVWGVQFHPEYGPEHGDRIWRAVFGATPEKIPQAPAEPARIAQNRLIFDNFAAWPSRVR